MFKQIEKLQQGAWPVIATVLVGTGGALGGVFQAETAGDRYPAYWANLAGLVGVVVLAAHAKGKNQLRRDKELGILDKDRNPTINAGNFVAATERCKDLDRQSTALIWAPGAVIATATFAPVAFAPAAAAIGCSLVLLTMGSAALCRKVGLKYDLRDAADAILEGCDGNTDDPAVGAAYSFLANLRQL